MPILEGPEIAHRERRFETLFGLKELLVADRDLVPCVRIGATDLSGLWGLRRTRDFTIYDVAAVADVIADVVNIFGRADGVPAISGPVWEYIHDEHVFKPWLRETPFREAFGADGALKRRELLSSALDGLLREALLDRVNGLHGKTVIHPTHIAAVDAIYAVSFMEYQDALAIVNAGNGSGVDGITVGERMNEPKPHRLWAERTLQRAEAFGVLRPEHTFLALVPSAI
jgi:citrate lyase beta subunit